MSIHGDLAVVVSEIVNQTLRDLKVKQHLENSTDGTLFNLDPLYLDNNTLSHQEYQHSNHQANTLEQIDNYQDVDMGQNERIFWILFFSIMVLVAAGGNLIVIYIVSTNKEMKSVTNYFLVNLSLADTMVSTLNVIFNFISMLNSHWPFGKVYCKISNFIAILSISASVFTLTAISCDRYNAIIHPLRPRMSHRHAIGWILLIWTLSAALAAPNLIYSVIVEDRLVNDNLALTCTMIWPDGRYPLSKYDHVYNIIILVVTYLVPISTMAILYYKVGKELWGHEAIGENVDKTQRRAMLAKKKIVKMMIVVVIIFALCWLPYHGFFVVNYYLPTIFQDGPLFYQRCYLIMYWLAMSNSMYNPIIIYFMNSKFRHEFKRVLWWFCCRTYTPPLKCDNSTINACLNTNNNNLNNDDTINHVGGDGAQTSCGRRKRFFKNHHSVPPSVAAKRVFKSRSILSPLAGILSGNKEQYKDASPTPNQIEVVITRSVEDNSDDDNNEEHHQVKFKQSSPGNFDPNKPFLANSCNSNSSDTLSSYDESQRPLNDDDHAVGELEEIATDIFRSNSKKISQDRECSKPKHKQPARNMLTSKQVNSSSDRVWI